MEIDGRYIEDIFGKNKINGFLDIAAELTNSITPQYNLILVLTDFLNILCLMACIVGWFSHLPWDLIMQKCAKLYGRVKAHAAENEQLYKNLFEALKLLVSDEILRVCARICSFITQSPRSLSAYIAFNWLILSTTGGFFSNLFAVWATIYNFFISWFNPQDN